MAGVVFLPVLHQPKRINMIVLNDKWALKSDEYCVSVCKAKKRKGQLIYEPKYFYNNYHQALAGIIDRDIQGIDLSDFRDVCKRITELKADIKKIVPELPLPTVSIKDFYREKRRHVRETRTSTDRQ